jgi:hypothetical protein
MRTTVRVAPGLPVALSALWIAAVGRAAHAQTPLTITEVPVYPGAAPDTELGEGGSDTSAMRVVTICRNYVVPETPEAVLRFYLERLHAVPRGEEGPHGPLAPGASTPPVYQAPTR